MYKPVKTRHLPEDSDGVNTFIQCVLRVLLVALVGVMAGCARTSTTSLDADTIEIVARVATICSGADAGRIAHRQAAVETIHRGFDDFIVLDSLGGDHLARDAPVTARTTLYGTDTGALFSEDAPVLAHHQVLTIRMFQAGQGESEASVSARAVLGDDWKSLVTKGAPATCLGIDG